MYFRDTFVSTTLLCSLDIYYSIIIGFVIAFIFNFNNTITIRQEPLTSRSIQGRDQGLTPEEMKHPELKTKSDYGGGGGNADFHLSKFNSKYILMFDLL